MIFRLAKFGVILSTTLALIGCPDDGGEGFAELEEKAAFQDQPTALTDPRAIVIKSYFPEEETVKASKNEVITFVLTLENPDPSIEYTFAIDGNEVQSGSNSFYSLVPGTLAVGSHEVVVTASNPVDSQSHTFNLVINSAPTVSSQAPLKGGVEINCEEEIAVFKASFEDADDDEMTVEVLLNGQDPVLVDPTILVSKTSSDATIIMQNDCENQSENNTLVVTADDGTDLTAVTWNYSVSEVVVDIGELGNSAIEFTPATHDFGYVKANTGESSRTIVAKNTSAHPIYIKEILGNTDQFSIPSHTCKITPLVFSPGESCTIDIKYAPKAAGAHSTFVKISYDDTAGEGDLFSLAGITGAGVGDLDFDGINGIDNVTNKSLRLNWEQQSNVTSFVIFKISSGNQIYVDTIVNENSNVTSYTVTGLQAKKIPDTHTYRVRAVDVFGNMDSNTSDKSATLLPNRDPSLNSLPNRDFFTGELSPAINANDAFSGGDTDQDGDPLIYSCTYERITQAEIDAMTNTPNGLVPNGSPNCDDLPIEGGGTASFNTETGILSGWTPRDSGGTTDVDTVFEIAITAEDPYDGTPFTEVFRVDIEAGTPPPPSITSASPVTSNVSVTTDNTPEVTGTARANMTIKLYANSCIADNLIGSGSADSNGDWTVTGTISETNNGTGIPVYASATNAIGNESACSTLPLTYYLDNQAPSVVTVESTNPVGPASKTTVTVSGQTEADATVKLFDNSSCSGAEIASGSADGSGNYAIAVDVSAPSITTFAATATDTIGNSSTCKSSAISYQAYAIGSGIAWFQGEESTQSTQLNLASAYALEWTSGDFDYDYFSWSSSSNAERVTIKQNGTYMVAATVPQTFISGTYRSAVKLKVYVNGSEVEGTDGESSYIRNDSGHSESSSHIATLIPGLSTNDYIEVKVIGTAGEGGDEAVNITSKASLYLEHIDTTSRKIFHAYSNVATNINTSGTKIVWDRSLQAIAGNGSSTGFANAIYTHTNGTEGITLGEEGDYLVFVNIPIYSTGQRVNPAIEVTLGDGTTQTIVEGGQGKQGYIRADSNHNNASVHWSGVIHGVEAGEILQIRIKREAESSTTTIQSGNYASLTIEKINTDSNVLSLTADRPTGSTNWNPSGTDTIAWSDSKVSDITHFGHDPSLSNHEIEIQTDGDYLLIYNDSLTSSIQRANPIIKVLKNGVAISGAEVKSHYIRAVSNHNESSGSLVFLLRDLKSDDVISITTKQEAAAGIVTSDDKAVLVLIRKP